MSHSSHTKTLYIGWGYLKSVWSQVMDVLNSGIEPKKLGKEIKCGAKIYWYLKLGIFNSWPPTNEEETPQNSRNNS